MSKVCIVGTGTWGTAAANLVADNADEVMMWARSPEVPASINGEHRNPRHLQDVRLADNVRATNSFEEAFSAADAAVLAVPSSFLRATCESMAPFVPKDLPLVSLTKGIEPGTHLLMSELVADVVGNGERVCALSGPNHAEEISRGKAAAAVVAGKPEHAELFQGLFRNRVFRVYVSADLSGVEMCAAVKNVIALACGIATGLDLGDNTLAALMTRGLAEIGRFVSTCGGDPLTCMGLAGMGDLIATCTSRHSRNRSFGEAFVAGESLEDYERRTNMVVEGARAARSAYELSCEKDIEAPNTRMVYAVLYEGLSLDDAIDKLLDRPSNEEFYGFAHAGEKL